MFFDRQDRTKEERKKEMYEIMEAIEAYSEEQLDDLKTFVLRARAQSELQNRGCTNAF